MCLEAWERKIKISITFWTKLDFRFHTELWNFTESTNNGTLSNYELENYAYYPMLFEVNRNFCRK